MPTPTPLSTSQVTPATPTAPTAPDDTDRPHSPAPTQRSTVSRRLASVAGAASWCGGDRRRGGESRRGPAVCCGPVEWLGLGVGHTPAGGRLASQSSMTCRGQPMEFAPSCSAWGNVPSARHRHSVRRLTPMRSSTSGTRNMASVGFLGDISASPEVDTDRASWRNNLTRWNTAQPARHAKGSRSETGRCAAVAGAGGWGRRYSGRRGVAGDAGAGVGGAHRRRGGNRAVMAGGHGPQATKSPGTHANAGERWPQKCPCWRSASGRCLRRGVGGEPVRVWRLPRPACRG